VVVHERASQIATPVLVVRSVVVRHGGSFATAALSLR
jgi:hypothetical protein